MILSLLLLALAQAPPVDLLITGGTIVTVDREMRIVDGGAIAIRGNRIDAIIPNGSPLPPAKETIEASGQIVIPGLINTHGHVPMVLLRGIADDMKLMDWLTKVIFPAEAKNVDADFCYWGTLLGSIEMLRSGTTTFTDMYYFEDDIARAVDKIGMRAVLGQTIIGFPAPDYKTTAAALSATEAFITKYKSHPRVIPSSAPHGIYTTAMDVVRKARDLSIKYGVPFQIHARESPDEDAQVTAKFGKSTIQVLDEAGILGPGAILHHTVTVNADDIKRIAAKGSSTSHNPGSNLKVAAGFAPVVELQAAGVAVGLGTDGAASNNSLDLFEEMMTAAKVQKAFRNDTTVMSARTVFKMATIDGARALGLADRIGSIEPGKLADLAIVDPRVPELTPLYDVYSALVYTAKGSHVRTVIVDGRVIVRDRRMTTVDADEVMTHGRQIQQRILTSLGKDAAR